MNANSHRWDVLECDARPGTHWYYTCTCGVVSQCWPSRQLAVQYAQIHKQALRADNRYSVKLNEGTVK